ncbi:MAG: hypothetical protein GX552_14760 [Chloroflexi bacterium]|nr:hypothetical protein [Chloroflexota bacterium]
MHPSAPTTKQKSARPGDICLLLALAFALLAALPLLIGPGIVNTRAGGDSPFLLLRVDQLARNLRAGVFPARLMPDAAQGLGYPFYNFYAALPYYLAALLHLAGVGVLWSIKLTQAAGFLLAGWAMYALARRMGARPVGALLASAAYTFAPFHLVNVYIRGDSLSEFYAMALFPLILWALLRLRERPSPGNILLLAASFALLPLTHNISAMTFSPLVGLWLLAVALEQRGEPTRGLTQRQEWRRHFWRRHSWRVLGAGAAALALGLLLSAWFWAPALREQSLVQLQEQTTGFFHYSGHFRGANLVQTRLLNDYTIDAERNPFNMGLFQAALAVLGLLALAVRVWRERRLDASQGLAVLALLVYTWLITPSSAWVWEHVPLLPMVQFPWRMLSIQALAIALLAANLPYLWPRKWSALLGERANGWLGGAFAVFIAATAAVTGMGALRVDRLPITEADVTPQRMMLYETISGNIGSTVRHEYLPREMVPRPYVTGVQLNGGNKPAPMALEGALDEARLLASTPTTEEWHVSVPTRALLAFHTTFYPGWEATVDGTAQGVEPLDGLGLIGLRLEPGAHTVRLHLEHTPIRQYAEWISTLALGGWLLLGAYAVERAPQRRRQVATVSCIALVALTFTLSPLKAAPFAPWEKAGMRVSAPFALWEKAGMRVSASFAPWEKAGMRVSAPFALWEKAGMRVSASFAPREKDGMREAHSLPGPLVLDIGRAPYLHHEPQGVYWGKAVLQDYQFDATLLKPGESLTLTMTWAEALPEYTVQVRLVGVTAHLLEPAPVWAEASANITGQETTLVLALPDDLPPGLYLPRVTVSAGGVEQSPETAAGVGMSTLSLAPVQIVTGRWATGQEPVLATFGAENAPPAISLMQAGAVGLPDGQVEARLTWRSERQAPLNYALSVRLRNGAGEQIVSRDLPPLLGGYPTSLWQPGELVTDRVVLSPPEALVASDDYSLEIVLYDLQTLQAAGVAFVEGLSLP